MPSEMYNTVNPSLVASYPVISPTHNESVSSVVNTFVNICPTNSSRAPAFDRHTKGLSASMIRFISPTFPSSESPPEVSPLQQAGGRARGDRGKRIVRGVI